MTVPIIITAEMGKADQAWANGLRRAHYPADRNMVDAHITLFHHLPPSHIAEVKARLAALAAEYPAPTARLSELMQLGGGVAALKAPSFSRFAMRWQKGFAACSFRRTKRVRGCTSPSRTRSNPLLQKRCMKRFPAIFSPDPCRFMALLLIIIAAARGNRLADGHFAAE